MSDGKFVPEGTKYTRKSVEAVEVDNGYILTFHTSFYGDTDNFIGKRSDQKVAYSDVSTLITYFLEE